MQAIKAGKANRQMRRSLPASAKVEKAGEPMSYAKKNMKIMRLPTQHNKICKECHLRERQNGSSRCKSCARPVKK